MVKRRLTKIGAAAEFLPPQRPPVKRPDLIDPYAVVDLENGDAESLLTACMLLIHGANFNDPPRYQFPTIQHLRAR